jgi:hypothetical protein
VSLNTNTANPNIHVVQSLSSWTVVLSRQGIHILLQKSTSALKIPLDAMQVCNVDITAENITETYWQEIPVRRLLWH